MPDGVRYSRTLRTKLDAEAWLATERALIDRDQWPPPAGRLTDAGQSTTDAGHDAAVTDYSEKSSSCVSSDSAGSSTSAPSGTQTRRTLSGTRRERRTRRRPQPPRSTNKRRRGRPLRPPPQRQVDAPYPASVRRWEAPIAEAIGDPDQPDDHTHPRSAS